MADRMAGGKCEKILLFIKTKNGSVVKEKTYKENIFLIKIVNTISSFFFLYNNEAIKISCTLLISSIVDGKCT